MIYFDNEKFHSILHHLQHLSVLFKGFQQFYLYTGIKALFILDSRLIEMAIQTSEDEYPEFVELVNDLLGEKLNIRISDEKEGNLKIML